MKGKKAGPIGMVVGDETIRAAQRVDGTFVFASVPIEENPRKAMRLLLSSGSFSGRDVALGFEGGSVLIESLVLPGGSNKSPAAVAAERLKGDPVFDADKAAHGVAAHAVPDQKGGSAESLAIVSALRRDRLNEVMSLCHDVDLTVLTIEAAPLALWRAWPSTGVEARMVRGDGRDVILVGSGETLLFCRVVEGEISGSELNTTLARASSLIGAESFERLTTSGVSEEARGAYTEALGITLAERPEESGDPCAIGLATPGPILSDFLPPEEKEHRERRRVRKVRAMVAAGVAVIVLISGLVGWQDLDSLEERKLSLEAQRELQAQEEIALAEKRAEIEKLKESDRLLDNVRPGHRMSTLFALLANSASEGVFLETVKIQDIEDPTTLATEGKVRRRVLEIRLGGVATSSSEVREFVDTLLDTKAFSNVRVDASERVLLGVGVEGERFRIFAKAETQ